MPSPTPLLAIAQRLNLPHIKEIAKQAGVKTVFRVTTHYPDRRSYNSVATLVCSRMETPLLEVVYEGFMFSKTIKRHIPETTVNTFIGTLSETGFDQIPDQPNPNLERMTLWLVERASGSFYTSIVLSPHRSEHPYLRVVNAIDDFLPEATREINQS